MGRTHDGHRPTRRERLLALRGEAQARLEDTRATSRNVDAMFVATGRDRAVGGNLLACAIAFRVFIWMLPLTLLVAATLGFLHSSASDRPAEVGEDLGLGESVLTVVSSSAEQAHRSRVILLFLALFGLYTAGSAGAKTAIAVYRFAWGVPPVKQRSNPLASLLFTAALLALTGLALLGQAVRENLPGFGLTATIVAGVMWTFAWWGLSALLPHADAPLRRLVPGALLMGAGSQALHLVAVYYLARKVDSASELYGGLGVAATALLGLYLLARLVVGSAVLNATLWEEERAERARAGSGVADAAGVAPASGVAPVSGVVPTSPEGVDASPSPGDVEQFELSDAHRQRRVDEQPVVDRVEPEHRA